MSQEPLAIDGSAGEGGGQILRTALALAMATGTPIHLYRIRAGRQRPGLQAQHLAAVRAAAAVCRAEVEGDRPGSRELRFRPGPVEAGEYGFAIGTAGSVTLVLQTVLPALLLAPGPSRLWLEGGTHNPLAPPADFLAGAYLPLLGRLGAGVAVALERPGFYPAGGGRLVATVRPAALKPLHLGERGPILARLARARVARLPRAIAERELRAVQKRLGWSPAELVVEEVRDSSGPGNVLTLELRWAEGGEVFSACGRRGVPAEVVAAEAIEAAERFLAAAVPVGPHLADQLLLPLALAGGGSFLTQAPTAHFRTNLEVIRRFLPLAAELTEEAGDRWRVALQRLPGPEGGEGAAGHEEPGARQAGDPPGGTPGAGPAGPGRGGPGRPG